MALVPPQRYVDGASNICGVFTVTFREVAGKLCRIRLKCWCFLEHPGVLCLRISYTVSSLCPQPFASLFRPCQGLRPRFRDSVAVQNTTISVLTVVKYTNPGATYYSTVPCCFPCLQDIFTGVSEMLDPGNQDEWYIITKVSVTTVHFTKGRRGDNGSDVSGWRRGDGGVTKWWMRYVNGGV